MSPKQLPVKMESKKNSSDPSWNVVGNNDGSAVPPRNSPDASTLLPSDKRSFADSRATFVRAAKELPDVCDDDDTGRSDHEFLKDFKMPSLPNKPVPSSDDHRVSTSKKVNEILKKIDPMTNIIVKVFYSQKKLFGFPLLFGNILDNTLGSSIVAFSELHHRVSIHCDDALESRKYKSIFVYAEIVL